MVKNSSTNPIIILLLVFCVIVAGGVVLLTLNKSGPSHVINEPPDITGQQDAGKGTGKVLPPKRTPIARVETQVNPYGDISGMVVNVSGQPRSNIAVELINADTLAAATGVSSSSGAFLFSRQLPGRYMVRSVVEGYAVSGYSPLNLMADSENKEARVVLTPHSPIRGQVSAHISNKRLGGAKITASIAPRDAKQIYRIAPFHQSITAITDASGRYQLAGLYPDVHYNLLVEATGYVRGSKNFVASGLDNIDFLLTPGGGITGTVILADGGLPATGAIVLGLKNDFTRFSTVAGDNGEFYLDGLSRGVYQLDAQRQGYYAVAEPNLEAIHVEIGKVVEGVTIELRKGGSISGVVSKRPSHLPVFGAIIELSGASSNNSLETDAEGRYQLSGLRDGAYQISARAVGSSATKAFFVINNGTDVVKDFELSDSDIIAGFTTDSDGNVVAGARVRYSRKRDNGGEVLRGYTRYRGDVVSDSTGYFKHQPLEPGYYDLLADATSFAPGRLDNIETGEENVRLVLSRGGNIVGTVTSASGAPLENVRVSAGGSAVLNGNREVRGDSTNTDASGRYRMENMEPGNYVVMVRPPRYRPSAQELEERERLREERRRQSRRQGDAPDGQSNSQSGGRVKLDKGAGTSNSKLILGDPKAAVKSLVRKNPMGGAEMRTSQVVKVHEGETVEVNFGERYSVTIEGQVFKDGKVASEGIMIALGDAKKPDMRSLRRWSIANTRTDSTGKFKLSGLLPGAVHYVHASRDMNTAPVSKRVELPDQPGRKIVSLELPSTGIRGVVVKKDGLPVNRARVTLIPKSEATHVVQAGFRVSRGSRGGISTDREGAFKIDEIPPGDYFLRVTSRDLTHSVEITVKEQGNTSVKVVLQEAGGLRGTIIGVGVDAKGYTDCLFVCRDRDTGASLSFNRRASEGRYTIDEIHPGAYDVTCMIYSRQGITAPAHGDNIIITPGQTVQHNFVMSPGVKVQLSIVDAAGAPLRDCMITVGDSSGVPVSSGVVATEMTHNIWSGNFERKTYNIVVSKEGYKDKKLKLALSHCGASISKRVVLELN
jgi:Carboxypeptidase regulatory-like domain